jgi:hypothetical protein
MLWRLKRLQAIFLINTYFKEKHFQRENERIKINFEFFF